MVLLVLVIGFVALNLVAARQVYALTHFVPAGASLEQQLAVPLPQKFEMPFVSSAPEVWVQAMRAFLDAVHATFSASGMLSVPPEIRHT